MENAVFSSEHVYLPFFFFFFNADSKFYLDKYQFNITQSVLTGEDVNYCGDAEDA